MNLQLLQLSDSTATIIVSVCMALSMAAVIAYISGRTLWLSAEQKVHAFIIGLALMSSLAVAQFTPFEGWNVALLYCLFPALLTFIYFIPTMLAIALDSDIFRGVFLVNLTLGWTLVGYIAAIMMALRPQEREDYSDLQIRLTPLGVVPRTGIGYTAEERLNAGRREMTSAPQA